MTTEILKQNALSRFILFNFEVLAEILSFKNVRTIGFNVLMKQILFTGFEAFAIISLIGFAIGGLIVAQGNAIFSGFVSSRLFYSIMVTLVIRELGALLTAFIIIARSGTAISAELGNMVVNNEMEALMSFGISPVSYLVAPRVMGMIASIVVLNIYFNATALISGGFIASYFYSMNLNSYFSSIFEEVKIMDFIIGLTKSVLFGYGIGIISSYQGFAVVKATTEVPQRTIKAVVYSLAWIIMFDIFISILSYT